MSRPLMLSNGRMLVGINQYGLVHDFYYPYVGLENHASGGGLRHKVGVWVDSQFSWLDDGNWRVSLDYEEDALIGNSHLVNDKLQIALELHDFMDAEQNVFCRNIHVVNNADHTREVRVFLHQVLQISESTRGDTALYIPDDHAILDYKGNRAFVIYGETADGQPFDQYSIGNYAIEGKEGTYKDAEDGELENNAVEHGRVDTVIRFKFSLKKHSSDRIHYWITAAVTNVDALKLHQVVKSQGFTNRYQQTQAYWHSWMQTAEPVIKNLPRELIMPFKKSLLISKSHIDARGSVLASGDSQMLNYARDYYSYCWPRDAAYVVWPLMRVGHFTEARAFFEFCRDVLAADGYLLHKYLPDRSVGSSWHPYVHEHHTELPIQEDETAIVLFMVGEYLRLGGNPDTVQSFYSTLIRPLANFLDSHIDATTKLPHASYDLWEEKFLTTTYTVGVVHGALQAAARIAEEFEYPDDAIRWQTQADDIREVAHDMLYNEQREYFYKGYLLRGDGSITYDDVIDVSSLFGATMFGLYDSNDPFVLKSMQTLEEQLADYSPSGGVPRYEHDQYHTCGPQYLGNPWPVTSLWLAQMHIELDNNERARAVIDWTQSLMLKSGVLPEQIHPDTGRHLSVEPLIWSQAEFINTVLDYVNSQKK